MAVAAGHPHRLSPIAKAAAAAFLIGTIYLVARNLVIANGYPLQIKVRFPPAAGDALLQLQADPGISGRIDPDMLARGLQRAPLSEAPFLIAAERARQMQDFERSSAFLEAAVRRQDATGGDRDPLLSLLLLRGHWIEAIDLIRRMWPDRPDEQPWFADQLLQMTSDLRGRALLLRRAAEDRKWRQSFLPVARRIAPGDPFLAELETYRRASAQEDGSAQADGAVGTLTFAGYAHWVAHLGKADIRKVGAVFDGHFRGGTPASPFAWTLANGGQSRARTGIDGLSLSVTGVGPQTLAVQHLVLPPDRYRLELDYTIEDSSAGRLAWTLQCRDGRRLATIDLSASSKGVTRPFTVAPGCEIQRLALVGSSRSSTEPLTAKIARIRIVRTS